MMETEARIAEIQEVLRTDRAAYEREGLDREYHGLLAARETGQTIKLEPSKEIENIRELMVTDRARYEREGHDKRYLALLSRSSRTAVSKSDGAVKPLPIEDWRREVEAAGLDAAEIEAQGGYDLHLATVRTASDVLSHLSSDSRKTFEAGFDALPEGVHAATMQELASEGVTSPPASTPDLDRFASRPEGAAALKAWGEEAPARLGNLKARFERWLMAMDPPDIEAALTWFNNLSEMECKAIYETFSR